MQKTSYGYIYKTINLINNRIYIGKKEGTFNQDYLGSGIAINRAIKKHGRCAFKLSVIVYSNSREELNNLEKFYIAEHRKQFGLRSLYNITGGGDGFLCKHTEATKKKMSKSRLGHLTSLETRAKIGCANSIALKGKPLSHKDICKCFVCQAKRGDSKYRNIGFRNGMFGRRYKHTEETKNKIRKTKAINPFRHSIQAREKMGSINRINALKRWSKKING